MIVCSCFAVTDRDLRAALRAAREGRPVTILAGTSCGCCRETLISILQEESKTAELAAQECRQACSGGNEPP
jgi:bacterioferritin-associated ferredoxin